MRYNSGIVAVMPRPAGEYTYQIAFRIAPAWIVRAVALIPYVGSEFKGMNVTRTDILRIALERGLAELEKECAKHEAG